jgi:purine-nucleoside phosphorylase
MDQFIHLSDIDAAVNVVRGRIQEMPKVGIILGSGLGGLADAVKDPVVIPYKDIPTWPMSTVQGHVGRLVIGALEHVPVMVMQGRAHYYEGYPMDQITLPIRVMTRLGVPYLIVTNAAGAINPNFIPGDVMLITDQISLIGMTGLNPLRGPNIDEIGERFPDMSRAYDRELCERARTAAKQAQIDLKEGVYICLSGPSFETPADLRFLKFIGADAVGMSTVPEVIVARHGKMRVLGLSGISNKANLDGNTETTHEEVLQAGKIILPKLKQIILGVLSSMRS